MWDIRTGKQAQVFNSKKEVLSVVFSPDGSQVATASNDKSISLWDIETGQRVSKLEGHDNDISAVVFSPDGKFLISGSHDRSIILWDIAKGSRRKTFIGHENEIISLAISRDGNRLVSLEKWHHIPMPIDAFFGAVKRIRQHPESEDKHGALIIVWDVTSGQIIKRIKAEKESEAMALSPDGHYLLLGQKKDILVYKID